jgi:hypothetical protein
MPGPLSGVGVLLQQNQFLYPADLIASFGGSVDVGTNEVVLAPGSALPLMRGDWLIDIGGPLIVQWADPTTGIFRTPATGFRGTPQFIQSDGQNVRVANLTGCPVGAVVTNAGSGYPTSGTTCTASGAGGSTWLPIVGGQLSITTVNTTGSGYGIAPLVIIPAPPTPGVQATAYATLASGTVSGVTLTNRGAGYLTAPPITILPNPADPNLLSTTAIVNATATAVLIGAGSIAAILCTNPGAPVTTAPTLTITGTGGSSATATAQLMQTLTGATVISGGTGITDAGAFLTVGGVPTSTAVNTNPDIELISFIPRPATGGLANTGGSLVSVSTIYDGGLFVGATPTLIVTPTAGSVGATGPSVVALVGSANGLCRLQQLRV